MQASIDKQGRPQLARVVLAEAEPLQNPPPHLAGGESSTRRGEELGVGGAPPAAVLPSPPPQPSPTRGEGDQPFAQASPRSKAAGSRPRGRLTEADAVRIWIARARRLKVRDIAAELGCDTRRLYEIWTGARFPAAREKAIAELRETAPALADSIRLLPHLTISRAIPEGQLELFPASETARK